MSAMVCPRCKNGGDVVAFEDGVWMCTACAIEFDVNGRSPGLWIQVDNVDVVVGDSPSDGVSTTQKNGTVIPEIKLDSVGDVEELYRKLIELLKRPRE